MKTSYGRTLLPGVLLGLLAATGFAQVSGWGESSNLQLLVPGNTHRLPLPLNEIGSPVAIAAGDAHAYALNADGTVTAWGSNSGNQLGTPDLSLPGEAPKPIPGLPPIARLFSSTISGYGVTASGELWAWGWNGWGQLGIGNKVNGAPPVLVGQVGADANIIPGGDSRVMLLKGDGTLYGAGYNYNHDLGQGSGKRTESTTFIPIPLTNVVGAAYGGTRTAVALTASGDVYEWGSYYGDSHTMPTLVPEASGLGFKKIGACGGATFGITADGTVYSWGYTDYGVLGRYPLSTAATPTPITGLPPIAEVYGSRNGSAYALGRDGSVWSWGYNQNGQLGDGSNTNRYEPVRVTGIGPVASLAVGRSFVLAQAAVANLTGFTLAETTTRGHRAVKGKVVLDRPAGVGGVTVNLASREVGATLPHGLSTTNYNGLTIAAVPSPRPTLKKVWRIRNRTASTHTYRLIVLGEPQLVTGSVAPGHDGYFVSTALNCLNIAILLDDTNHIVLGIAGNASGPLPVNLFARVAAPGVVVVPEGATEAEFDVFAQEVPVDATVQIVASQGATTQTSTLKVLLESDRATP